MNPINFRGTDNAHDYIGRLFKIVMAGLVLIIFGFVFVPDIYKFLLPIVWLENQIVQFVGIGLLLLSLGWTVTEQIQMGNSWRIGIDEEKKTALMQSGLFRFSRNPIFLGMIATLIGVFAGDSKRFNAFGSCSRICFDSNTSAFGRRIFNKTTQHRI